MRKVVLPSSSAARSPISAGVSGSYRMRSVRLAAQHLNYSSKRLSYRAASQIASEPKATVRAHVVELATSASPASLGQGVPKSLLQDERVLAALVVLPLLAGLSALALNMGHPAGAGARAVPSEVVHEVRLSAPLRETGRETLLMARIANGPAETLVKPAPQSAMAYTLHEQTWRAPAERLCHVRDDDGVDANPSAQIIQGPAESGERLAAAAEMQLNDLVVYDDRYRLLKYPMGDVEQIFGVCTDVIVRAYRAIGIDLQQLVKKSGIGRGDTNIDHRRTVILRRFFARYGKALPVSDIADDFSPGDIVTYERPQNFGSNWHIAIVSRVRAPSGRLMIIHNRGWGPQLEDALFVDRITGHYRFDGSMETAELNGPKLDLLRVREGQRGVLNRSRRRAGRETNSVVRKSRIRKRMRETSAVISKAQIPGS